MRLRFELHASILRAEGRRVLFYVVHYHDGGCWLSCTPVILGDYTLLCTYPSEPSLARLYFRSQNARELYSRYLRSTVSVALMSSCDDPCSFFVGNLA